jgi:MoaA/NifB/PqqE/SkfB family radical SAM enzyme
LLHGLVDAELDHLIISISGVSQPTYEQYHRGGKLERVWSKLASLVDYRRRQGKSKPLIELKYLEFGYNRQEARPALAQARRRGVDTFVVRHGTTPHQDDAWPGLPTQDRLGRRLAGRACCQLWDTVVLNADGGVAPCCYLYQQADDYGRYTGNGFGSIWNNEHFVNARRLFNPGEVGRLAPQMELSCLKCALVHSQAHLRAYLAANRNAAVGHLTGWQQEDA